MKICFIKQFYDVLGPFSSYKFDKINIDKLMDMHYGKFNGFQNLLHFEMDHYILDSYNFKRHECDVIKNNNMDGKNIWLNLYNNLTKNTYKEDEIPFDDYDVIYCRDPILKNIKELKLKYPNKLFVYEEAEHERGYCEKTSKYYDLQLIHHKFKFFDLNKLTLPMKISFPYTTSPNKLRTYFKDIKKNNNLFIDYRDIIFYKEKVFKLNNNHDSDMLKTYELLLKKYPNICCNIKNSLNGICFSSEGKSDVKEYLSKIASCKYFCSLAGRVGQSLVDAASLNSICIGTMSSPNHCVLCHPSTIFPKNTNLDIIISRINEIENNIILQEEILKYQNERLFNLYCYWQTDVFKKALEIKKKK